jgi:hypothetical protein
MLIPLKSKPTAPDKMVMSDHTDFLKHEIEQLRAINKILRDMIEEGLEARLMRSLRIAGLSDDEATVWMADRDAEGM